MSLFVGVYSKNNRKKPLGGGTFFFFEAESEGHPIGEVVSAIGSDSEKQIVALSDGNRLPFGKLTVVGDACQSGTALEGIRFNHGNVEGDFNLCKATKVAEGTF